MTVKDAQTVKERLIKRIETLNEAQLLELDKQLDDLQKEEKIKRQLEVLRNVAGMLSDPEDYAAFEKASRRHSLFGGRTLDLEPDEG